MLVVLFQFFILLVLVMTVKWVHHILYCKVVLYSLGVWWSG